MTPDERRDQRRADLRRVLRLDVPGLTAQVRETLAALQAVPGRSADSAMAAEVSAAG